MASKVLFPSLDEDGWINESTRVADKIISQFLLSDYSQSYCYQGHISSMAWILQNNQGDMVKTTNAVQKQLATYFGKYFNNVVVEVTDATDPTAPSKGAITLYIKYTDTDNKEFIIGKVVEHNNSIISKVVDINNNGV